MHPVPFRGAFRGRHGRGAGCGGRDGGEGRALSLRTVKSCGPDTPTLVSSSRQGARMTVARKPGHRGERGIGRKPLRRESRIASAEPVCSCAFYPITIAHGTAGAARTRSSLRPLVSWGEIEAKLGRSAPRDLNACLEIVIARRKATKQCSRRVGKDSDVARRATTESCPPSSNKMVGTAQARLCPPYEPTYTAWNP